MIHIDIKPELQQEVESILAALGVSADTVVAHLYEYIREERRLPEQLRIPNIETQEVFAETDAGKNVVEYASPADLYSALGI
jgi:antitoxin component of RelBE/YafQ-DinJ toxin-antitoxin module